MSFDLGKLFIEWRRIVPNGVPNPGNDYHLVLLKEVCLANGIDVDTTNNVILALEKKDDEKIKWKDKDGRDRETGLDTIKQYASDIKSGDSSQNKELAVKAANLGDKETGGEEETEEKPTPAIDFSTDTHIEKGLSSNKDNDIDSGEEEEKPKTKEELEQTDHQIVDDTLVYTKTQAKKDQDKTGGRKGVGLGTDASRAGEAAVHKGIRMMMKGDSIEEVYSLLRGVAEEKDTFLTNEWVDAAVSSIKAIKNEVGIEKIETVAWDTDEGRESIGVNTKLETSSDMFVRTKDGKNIGVSLKDSGDVFLANGGWKEQSDNLLDELKSDMPEVEHGQLKEAMDIDTFKENRASSFRNVLNQLGTDGLEQMIKNIQDDSSKPIGNYIDKLS